jgi:hypothetical protein
MSPSRRQFEFQCPGDGTPAAPGTSSEADAALGDLHALPGKDGDDVRQRVIGDLDAGLVEQAEAGEVRSSGLLMKPGSSTGSWFSTRPRGVSCQALASTISGASSRISRLPSEKTISVGPPVKAASSASARAASSPGALPSFIAPIGRLSGDSSRLRIVASLRALVAEPL